MQAKQVPKQRRINFQRQELKITGKVRWSFKIFKRMVFSQYFFLSAKRLCYQVIGDQA